MQEQTMLLKRQYQGKYLSKIASIEEMCQGVVSYQRQK